MINVDDHQHIDIYTLDGKSNGRYYVINLIWIAKVLEERNIENHISQYFIPCELCNYHFLKHSHRFQRLLSDGAHTIHTYSQLKTPLYSIQRALSLFQGTDILQG